MANQHGSITNFPILLIDNGDGTYSPQISLATGATITSTTSAPVAANILNGYQALTSTTAATTLITVPAGRTWVGVIGANCVVHVAAASTAAGAAIGTLTVAGTGVTPTAGTVLEVAAACGANASGGTVGTQDSTFGSTPITVIAPVGNSVTVQVATTNTGTSSRVSAFASGSLV